MSSSCLVLQGSESEFKVYLSLCFYIRTRRVDMRPSEILIACFFSNRTGQSDASESPLLFRERSFLNMS